MVINPIVGVYIPIIRIPIKGGMTMAHMEGKRNVWIWMDLEMLGDLAGRNSWKSSLAALTVSG